MPAKFHPVPTLCILILILIAVAAHAQAGATLAGLITPATGEPIPRARISAKNLNTGQSTDTQADAVGHFDFSAAAPADFEITISADGFDPKVTKISFLPGGVQTLTVVLSAIPGWTPPPQTRTGGHRDRRRLRRGPALGLNEVLTTSCQDQHRSRCFAV